MKTKKETGHYSGLLKQHLKFFADHCRQQLKDNTTSGFGLSPVVGTRPISQFLQGFFDLAAVNFLFAFRPSHKISAGDFLFRRQLRRNSAVNLVIRPAA